jgi:hypothetical protein
MYSQFSEVKFSSVALADVGQSEKQVGLRRRTLTDDIVEGILLSPKHCATGEKAGREIRSNMVFVEPKVTQSV